MLAVEWKLDRMPERYSRARRQAPLLGADGRGSHDHGRPCEICVLG
jgi:hypothetical protein